MKTCTAADLILLALFLAGNIWLYVLAARGQAGHEVLVLAQDHPLDRLDLQHDQLLEIPGRLGTSVLEIRDGAVRMRSSPCLRKICLQSGWARQAGDFIACLPNGVALQVQSEKDAYDAIHY